MQRNESSIQFIVISKHRLLHHYLPKFNACLHKIDNGELWHKETSQMNSIGGIILHILEHIHRNAERLRNPEIRFDKGIEQHFPDAGMGKDQLRVQMNDVFEKFAKIMAETPVQYIDMYNLYHLVEHTGYHLGQVVDRVHRITGQAFGFVQNGIHERNLRDQVQQDKDWYF